LKLLLPSPEKIREKQGIDERHHPALPQALMPDFMADLRLVDTNTARTLEMSIMCAMRSGEVRMLTWAEVDMTEKLISIPRTRMKGSRAHIIPLSTPVLNLLKLMQVKAKQRNRLIMSFRT